MIMETDNEITPVEVFSGTIWQAEMLKNLLEDAEIKVYLKDEINGTIFPFLTSPGGVGAVSVVVSSVDYDNAKTIVDDYKNNLIE